MVVSANQLGLSVFGTKGLISLTWIPFVIDSWEQGDYPPNLVKKAACIA